MLRPRLFSAEFGSVWPIGLRSLSRYVCALPPGAALTLVALAWLAGCADGCGCGKKAEPAPAVEPEPPAPAPQEPDDLYIPEGDLPDESPAEDEKTVAPEPKKSAQRPSERPVECKGELSAEDAKTVVGRHTQQVRQCYERRLRENTMLQGRVELRLTIDTSGNVTSVRTSGTLRDAEVLSCISAGARTWRFPKPSGASCAIVLAPFNLTPTGT